MTYKPLRVGWLPIFGVAVTSDFSNSTPPGGRRKNSCERELALLEAAFAAFTANGYAGTSIDQVAQAAGVSKASIYLYHESKEALFEAVLSRFISPVFDDVDSIVGDFEGSSEELLRQRLKLLYQNLVCRPQTRAILRLVVAESARFPEIAALYERQVIARSASVLRMIIWRGVAREEFRRTGADKFPQLVAGPVIAAALWQILFGEDSQLDIETYADAHVDLLLYGLKRQAQK